MKLKAFTRRLAAVLVVGLASQTALASNFLVIGTFSDFGTPNNPAPDLFTIHNRSSTGLSIVEITIDLSGASNTPVFDTMDGASPEYSYGAARGVPVSGLNPLPVGFVEPMADQQIAWEESQSITLNFTDFDAGEAFAFTTDVDDVLNFFVSGREFAGALLSVVFSDGVGNQFSASGIYRNRTGTDALNDAFALVQGTAAVPVPGALLLMLSALGGLGFSRLRG